MNPAQSLQLNDIIAPPAIGFWPPAPGWWLLALLILLLPVLIWLLLRWRRHRRQQREPFSQGLSRLQALQAQQPALSSALCASINEALKIYCRQRYPQALALSGDDWRRFLRQHSAVFSQEQEQLLAHGPYRPDDQLQGNSAQLLQAARQWLQQCERQYRPGAAHDA